MIIDCYDIETEPIISLKDFYGEQKHIVDVCLIIFSQEIHTHLLCTEYSDASEPGVRRVRATVPAPQSQCSGQ